MGTITKFPLSKETEDTEFEISGGDEVRDYYAMLPHVVRKMGLSPEARLLYWELRAIIGESVDGVCFKSVKTLSIDVGISVGSVTRAKKELAEAHEFLNNKPLIYVFLDKTSSGRPKHRIKLSRIWNENSSFMEKKSAIRKKYQTANRSRDSFEDLEN
jgi:hypothetical protein